MCWAFQAFFLKDNRLHIKHKQCIEVSVSVSEKYRISHFSLFLKDNRLHIKHKQCIEVSVSVSEKYRIHISKKISDRDTISCVGHFRLFLKDNRLHIKHKQCIEVSVSVSGKYRIQFQKCWPLRLYTLHINSVFQCPTLLNLYPHTTHFLKSVSDTFPIHISRNVSYEDTILKVLGISGFF